MSESSKEEKKDNSKKYIISTRGAVQRDPNALALFHQGAELAKRLAEVGERNLFPKKAARSKSTSPSPSTSTAVESSSSDKNQDTSIKSEDISEDVSIFRSQSDSSLDNSPNQSVNFSTPNSSSNNVTLLEEKIET